MRRVLYWKRLLIVVAALVVCGGALFGIHHYQKKSQSSVIRERAEKLVAEIGDDPEKRDEAIKTYEKYLKFRPDDEDAFRKYAHLLFDQATAKPETALRTVEGVERFLIAFPGNTGERKRLVELYVKLARYNTARQHIEVLFKAPGGAFRTDIDVLEMAATCEQGQDLQKAIEHLKAAVDTGRAPVKIYQRALELTYANAGDPQRRSHIAFYLNVLLTDPRFVNDVEARIAAARFQLFMGEKANARENITHALTKMPGGADNADALLAAAELEQAEATTPAQLRDKLAVAEPYLEKAFRLAPKNLAVCSEYAKVLTLLGKRDEGVKVLHSAAAVVKPTDVEYPLIVDQLLDFGDKELTPGLIDRMEQEPARKPLIAYFRGRLALVQQDWQTALKKLTEADGEVAGIRLFHKKAMVGIAACYAVLQNPDMQLRYCERALKDDGGYPLAILGMAEAHAKMGKIEKALPLYRLIVNEYKMEDYRPDLVRLELLDVLGRAVEPGARDWRWFDDSLGDEKTRVPAVVVLHAESLVARGRPGDAVALLEKWLAVHPTDPKRAVIDVALARLKDGGTAASALTVLDAAPAAVQGTVEMRMARAGLLASRGKPPAPPEFDALADKSEGLPPGDRFRLYLALGQSAGRVADRLPDDKPGEPPLKTPLRAKAVELLKRAAALMPKDLTCRAALVDQGLAAGDAATVTAAITEMEAIEGPDGPVSTLARVAVGLAELRRVTDPHARNVRLAQFRQDLGRVREVRPGWSRVYIALATIDELEGKTTDALANYQTAIDLGDRQDFVIRRTVDLYRLKKQDERAVGLLNKLSTEMPLPDDLERYRTIRNILLSTDLPKTKRADIDRIAPAWKPGLPKEYLTQLLRGELLAVIGDDEDALKAFQDATDLVDDVPEVWLPLVSQLVRRDRLDEAKRAVGAAKLKLEPQLKQAEADERKLDLYLRLLATLGMLHETVGDIEAARTYFEKAVPSDPLRWELLPVRQLVEFYQRSGQGEAATKLLNAGCTSAKKDIARWARRHLAITMLVRPDAYNLRKEAVALVEQNLAVTPDDPEDLKARAMIWTLDPATREEGIRVLRHFGDRGELTPDEFYLLGRLAFDRGNYVEAEKYFKFAARIRPGVTAEHLASLVRVYLALNQFGLARNALDRLKANNPASWEAAREEARVLYRESKQNAAQGMKDDPQEFRKKVLAAVQRFRAWDAVQNLATRTGPLFEEVGLAADAKAAYEKYLSQAKPPFAHASLAIFHIRQRQTDEAIALAWKHASADNVLLTARLLTGAVRSKRPAKKETEDEIERWINGAVTGATGELKAGLMGARAELYDAQGKYAEAIREYEASLAEFTRLNAPEVRKDLVVNNLCMLLVLYQPQRAEEAVKLMTNLIDIRGPNPTFLDTRAVAYLVSSRPTEAIRDLDMALVQQDRAAYRFHLAWAYDLDVLNKQRLKAVDELKRARQLGLSARDLHPIEAKKYAELFDAYKVPRDD